MLTTTYLALTLCGLVGQADLGSNADGEAERAMVLTSNLLIEIDTSRPEELVAVTGIDGLGDGETVLAIDYRPTTGALYGVTSEHRVCLIDPDSGDVEFIGEGAYPIASDREAIEIAFEPQTDQLRVVGGQSGRNVRIDVDTAEFFVDDELTVADDPGLMTRSVGLGYALESATGSATAYVLSYDPDSGRTRLGTLGSAGGTPEKPNSGRIHFVADLDGVDGASASAIDVADDSRSAFVSVNEGSGPELVRIDLDTQTTTRLGAILDHSIGDVQGIAIQAREGKRFVRGDVDGDGAYRSLLDAVTLLQAAFNGQELPCRDAADADDDGEVSGLTDALFILLHGFGGGPSPSAPFPTCGTDPDGDRDGVDCARSAVGCEQ